MRKIGKEEKKALWIIGLIVIVLMFIVWNAKSLFLHPKQVPQVDMAAVDTQEMMILNGSFQIAKVTPTENGIVITLINTSCGKCGFYTTRWYPDGVHYEIGQVVNAELIFRYNGQRMYKLLSLKIK